MNRRTLMRAALGIVAGGTSGLTPKDVMSASAAVPISGRNAPVFDDPTAPCVDPLWQQGHELRQLLYMERERLERQIYRGMPPDIANKRSWSHVHKSSRAEKRLADIRDVIEKLDRPDVCREILDKLGVKI